MADIPGRFQSDVGGYSLVAQTLYRRGLTTSESARGFLDPDYYNPCPARELPALSQAADRIQAALERSETILVWGDFDVDGQTSTALLTTALADLGARVYHYIPNRASESHGIALSSLQANLDLIDPGLILTCDTGIDAIEPARLLAKAGVDLIITDHHQLPLQLPDALAIINPALLDPLHPLASLPGVGVAYKLIEEIYARIDRDSSHLLDLVALGIVADVAQLRMDTRYLLQKGLRVLQTTSRLGLRTLFEKADIKPAEINEDVIGFAIGPRLNALGRLADANSCVDFFSSSDPALIVPLAEQLDVLNQYRQRLTEEIFQESLEQVEHSPDLLADNPVLILAGNASWHPGIIGIVASRLVERFHKPVIMLTMEGDQARGSARSVPGVPISALISQAADVLISHGGHPMAAGVSLLTANIPLFRTVITEKYHSTMVETSLSPEVLIDAELPFASINPDFVADLGRLAPFGAGNPRLLFATRNVFLAQDRTIGRNENHRKLTLSDSAGQKQDFLWWNSVGVELPPGSFDIAYSLDLSSFRDQPQIQATLRQFRQMSQVPVYIQKPYAPALLDYRQLDRPQTKLPDILLELEDFQIWAEFSVPDVYPSSPRLELAPAENLILWTTPPSPQVFKQAIEKVIPKKIFLFAVQPDLDTGKSFLAALQGLLLHLQKNPQKGYDPELFAQRLAQTSALIETGLDWLHHRGDFDLSRLRDSSLVQAGNGEVLPGFETIDNKFKLLLTETSAYRAYFKQANINSLL